MKQFLKSLSTALVVAPLLVTLSTTYTLGMVSAETMTGSNQTSTDTTTEKTMEDRITQRKAEFKTKLTTLQQNRVKLRCKQAQGGGIKSLDGRIKGLQTSRKEVYTNLVDRLNKLVDKLKTKGIDTTKLESEITVIKGKIDTFNNDLATYKQDVGDLKDLNCSSDPVGFKASLESTRTERQTLVNDGKAIKDYVKNTIKPTLKDIRGQIDAENKTEDNKTSSNKTSSNQTSGGQ
ncbi:MAG TPA: hypothetical protein VLF39_03205 [Candidatus Saccharimonadales bacterium]|nr:hypothetical protein [Candidatus Saccharimonadales bacterium]